MPVISIKRTIQACCPSVLKPTLARIEASPLGYRLAKGVFWSMAGAVISRSLGIISSIVVARTLGKVGFGELGIIHSTVMMFQLFAGFGLGLTATKYVAEYRSTDPQKAGRIIAMAWMVSAVTGSICAIAMFIFAPWLAAHTLAAPHLSGLLRITGIALFITALNAAQNGALSGFEAFKTIATRNLIGGLFSFPIMITGVLLAGLKGAVWATVISCAANWFICHLAVRREARRFNVPLSFSGCLQELPLLWRFSLPAVLGGVMVTPVNWVCNALLVNQPDGYEEMGIFSAANQWYIMLLFLPGLLGGVVLPVLSERLGQKETKQSLKTMVLAIKVNALLVLPLVLIASIASPYIMSLYGDGFRSGWPTLVVILLMTGIISVQTPVGEIIAASGKMWIGLFMNLGWAIVYLTCTYYMVHWGALGLAIAKTISYISLLIITYIMMNYILNMGISKSGE